MYNFSLSCFYRCFNWGQTNHLHVHVHHYCWFFTLLSTLWIVIYLPVSLENDLVLTPRSDSSLPRHMMSANCTVLNANLNRFYIIRRKTITSLSHLSILELSIHEVYTNGNADNSFRNYDHLKTTVSEMGFFPSLIEVFVFVSFWHLPWEPKEVQLLVQACCFGC